MIGSLIYGLSFTYNKVNPTRVNGDLIINLKVTPAEGNFKTYKINGEELVGIDFKISLFDQILGKSVEVEGINGKPV